MKSRTAGRSTRPGAADHRLQHDRADRHRRHRHRPRGVVDAPPPGAERGRPGGHCRGSLHPGWGYAATRADMDGPRASMPRRTASSRTTMAACTAPSPAMSCRCSGHRPARWPATSPGGRRWCRSIITAKHESFFGQFLGQPEATVTTGAVAARETDERELELARCARSGELRGGQVHRERRDHDRAGRRIRTPASRTAAATCTSTRTATTASYNDACSNGTGAFKRSGTPSGQIIAPHIYIHGTCETAGGTVASPVTEGAPQIGGSAGRHSSGRARRTIRPATARGSRARASSTTR